MKPLSKELRNKFERTIENAREVAEEAAKIALEQLGVGEASPYSYLSEDERALRRRLRAHGRNLGDIRDSKTETQEIDRLVEEIAYEHWHRMLFARFLAENNLLMFLEDDDVENAVSVTLDECEDLASEMGYNNGWEVAAHMATRMLPQVFRANSPVFEIYFAVEYQNKLERLLSSLNREVFFSTDGLGWAYQFWQSKKKENINNSGIKIGERELPAVTQIFTEHYIVEYLIDNSIGSWWQYRFKSDDLIAKSRELFSFESLRSYVNTNNVIKTPDISEMWMSNFSEFKVLDPSCGSGQFLIAIFLKLVKIRMIYDKLTPNEACDKVISENIYGLEIDQRCVEIAAFALALEAWKFPEAGGFRKLPEMNIAWCGQSINVKKSEWLDLVDDVNQKIHMDALYQLFNKAPFLGSLINYQNYFDENTLFANDWEKIKLVLEKSRYKNTNENMNELVVVANGIDKALRILSKDNYDWVITNVPYLTGKKQADELKDYCEKYYSNSKYDLATVFLERCLEFVKEGGIVDLVMPQNWLFLTSYTTLRRELIQNTKIRSIAKLGAKAFQTPMWDFNVQLISIEKSKVRDTNGIWVIDVSSESSPIEKSNALISKPIEIIDQLEQMHNPDYRIGYVNDKSAKLLSEYAISMRGIVTGDKDNWVKKFWEIPAIDKGWRTLQSTPSDTSHFSGKEHVIDWSMSGQGMLRPGSTNEAYGKFGVAVGQMSTLPVSYYDGSLYDNNTAALVPYNQENLDAIWSFCSSKEFYKSIREIDQKLNVTNATMLKVPFDLNYWNSVAEELYPDGLPKPYSDDPTQWIFHGQPRKSVEPLQVAVARLLGYRWPTELDDEMELSDEAKALVEECGGLLSSADKDGIVCIPSVRGEAPASERLLNLIAAVYKDEDINMILPGLLSDADHAGKSLESWLRDKFFTQHYKLFVHRPFIWQIWDGLKDGFSALVNYHKLDRKNLETLIYTYLGDWITKQKSAMVEGIEGAEEKLNAAISLKKKLELILEGESPYDIFVRWKPLNKQPLGWEPDLNDGVRINIRPFMSVGDVGKKDAGVLRDKPNIKWTKDRGKDTENSPWYHLFGGDRINDHHVTLEEKKKAREEMR